MVPSPSIVPIEPVDLYIVEDNVGSLVNAEPNPCPNSTSFNNLIGAVHIFP